MLSYTYQEMGLFLSTRRHNDVRVHRTNPHWYIYEFDPKTNKLVWLRYDAFVLGKASKYRRAQRKSLGHLVSSKKLLAARQKLKKKRV